MSGQMAKRVVALTTTNGDVIDKWHLSGYVCFAR